MGPESNLQRSPTSEPDFMTPPLTAMETEQCKLTCCTSLPTFQIQTCESTLSYISEALDQNKRSLNTEKQQKQQIQDQLHQSSNKLERLQQELTHLRRTAEKKVIAFFLKY